MNCKDKQLEFEKAFEVIKTQLENELVTVGKDTEQKAKALAESSETDNNIAEGVGMAAGAAIGGYFGGPVGATVGATIGKEAGKLFEVEITNEVVTIQFDLPEVTIKNQEINLDLPQVTMKDNDIIFSSIEIVMVDKKVGQKPNTVCSTPTWKKPVPKCKVYWTDIIISVPEPRAKEIRITMSVPEIAMRTQTAVIGIPSFKMNTQEITFNVPAITIRSKQDIAKRLSDKANDLVKESEQHINSKKEIVKTQIKMDVIPKANEMFNCFRESILNEKTMVFASFDPSIKTIGESLKSMKVKGVPETDDDYIKMHTQLKDLVSQRDASLKSFDDALTQLDVDMKQSLESLINL